MPFTLDREGKTMNSSLLVVVSAVERVELLVVSHCTDKVVVQFVVLDIFLKTSNNLFFFPLCLCVDADQCMTGTARTMTTAWRIATNLPTLIQPCTRTKQQLLPNAGIATNN